MPQIVTVTLNPAVDKNCSVEQVVAERKLRCGEPTYHPGGGGINVARAVAELGGEVAACWPCGGAIGELLRQLLDDEGVEHYPIEILAMTRGNLIVYEESSEQQFRFGLPGATLTDEEIQSVLDILRADDPPPEYLVLSGSLPPDVDENLYSRIAKAMPASCRVILDTSGRPLRLGLQSPLFLIKPNMHELEQLAGRTIEDDSQIRGVARSLIEEGKVQAVVTSLGSGGAVLTTADEHEQIRSPTVKIRSKVGAGDSMVAGIVFALSNGKPLAESVRYGVAAGAAAVMTQGTDLCRRTDTERLFKEMTSTNAHEV
ncbi:MAG: 1-phosphofructokinase family hexose kinase [Planctomycetota bacterium]|nr:MAG: 1-phosphofructokinase family hexose kinase [Planctomycetota bacterium]